MNGLFEKNRNWSDRRTLFFKRDGKFLHMEVRHEYGGYSYLRGRNEERHYVVYAGDRSTNFGKFDTLEEISNKFQLWELKTTR